jgi:hypothetical protein
MHPGPGETTCRAGNRLMLAGAVVVGPHVDVHVPASELDILLHLDVIPALLKDLRDLSV